MTKLLIKVATEFNVGLTSIVEHLIAKGFEIDNKPTAKVTDEMYNALLIEFQSSINEKEQANQLQKVAPPVVKEKPIQKIEVNLFDTPVAPAPPPIPAVKPSTPEPEVIFKPEIDESNKPKLKIVGKIDLDKTDAPPKETKIETPAPIIEVEKPIEPEVPEEQELTRIEAPTLKGLKILGKIDTNKFKDPVKKKEEAKKVATPATDPNISQSEAEKRKRKRKRKKVPTSDTPSSDNKSNQRLSPNRNEPEVKTVTQKEVEEKIRATMARLSPGGKNKRQKMRRDKRDEIREKAEMLEASVDRETIQLTEFVTVSELSSLMDVPVTDVIMTCMNMGIIVSINQRLDAEVIEFLAEEFNKKIEFISAEATIEVDEEIEEDPKNLIPRAPIVTVMGHVDHGKTSLLDYIRHTNVVSGEAGGITQHIGAYEVTVGPDHKKITFLDTPGHEAFTAMRARGAKVTDVAVIIIAADDRIMPQTKEAISHAQAANLPIVFAINKVDKTGADPERIKNELSQMNFLVDSWGGKFSSQEISAKSGLGVDLLLEKIILEAEVLDLKANPSRPATGTVIEASLDKGRGYVAKLLVQNGTLNIGDVVLAGENAGKVKAMFNERGQKIKHAPPSTPVMVLGLTGAPTAGEKFKVMEEESEARQIATKRSQISREQANQSVLHKAVGQIIESDILLASASDAIVIGFQVRPSLSTRQLAEKEGVEIKLYSIIYEAIEEIKAAMEGMLEPTKVEKIMGQIEVREVFKITKVGTVAGGMVIEGKVARNNMIRVIRDGIVIYPNREGGTAELQSLKRFKDDAKEVKENMECGVAVKNFNDIKVGDIIEAYEITEVKQKLA
ncbi:MAG: translation initiation factor IF-2 [Saprospiraceae bacterium]|uniref:Translation initiation factor IF-2 n=1 Tax=Candidatus Defluviibacterium haderslevense TaxID=2981993 RepID=A0A9D7SCS9_9BACT|nr:translation initiation factor IF-2 [Candidatus Defluviibacterium haderslevense]